MWIVEKRVGIFTHYLSLSGKFQPGIEKAKRFASKQIAESTIKIYEGTRTLVRLK